MSSPDKMSLPSPSQSAYAPLLHPSSARLTFSPLAALSTHRLPFLTFLHMQISPNLVLNILPLVALCGQLPLRPLASANPLLSPALD
jgi:hypothetical protein